MVLNNSLNIPSVNSTAVVGTGSGFSSLAYSSVNTGSTLATRDVNGNSEFNNVILTTTSTVSAGQTITMTAGSAAVQVITGTSTVQFNLPDATTLFAGEFFRFNNNSTGIVTVNQQNGSTLVATVPAGGSALVNNLTNGTVQGTWDSHNFLAQSGTSGTAGTSVPGYLSANTVIPAYTTTATAAGTTTLTVASTQQQFFTGATTQTVVMPVTSTLVLGQSFIITNNSSGVVTVQSSGANTIQAMGANTQLVVTVILTSGTTAASWNLEYSSQNGGGSSIPTTATSNQVLQSVASSNPVWSTATYPATTTINRLLFSSAANVVGQIATANSSLLVTNASGVPSLSTTLPSGLSVTASNSGTNVSFSVSNTNTTNSSNSRIVISCANGASSTFAYVAFNPNLTGNQFNLGASSPTATGLNVWAGTSPSVGTLVSSMDFTGVQTLPLQPAFLAYLGTADANVTGDGTVYTLGSGNALTKSYDQGTNITTGGVFTAPLAGAYHFDLTIAMTGLVVQTSAQLKIVASGNTYLGPLVNPTPSIVSGALTMSFGVTVSMAANDTATFQVLASGSTLTVGISGTGIASYVSGSKVA